MEYFPFKGGVTFADATLVSEFSETFLLVIIVAACVTIVVNEFRCVVN